MVATPTPLSGTGISPIMGRVVSTNQDCIDCALDRKESHLLCYLLIVSTFQAIMSSSEIR